MRRVGAVPEFELIERVLGAAGAQPGAGVVLGPGDDAAVLRPPAGHDLVVSTDAFVEDVHFRWKTHAHATIGRRALVANLSDLAAMGARPLGCTLALALSPRLELARLLRAMRGLGDEARHHGCPLVGGNVTRARETSFAITVLGAVPRGRALRRHGARPGDRILVTGQLGASALALARAEAGGPPVRQVATPRIEAGRRLARLAATSACIDLSDGLAADLPHLLAGDRLGADLDPGRVPVPRGLPAAARRLGVDPAALALAGGEDYELLFTLRGGPAAGPLGRRLGVPVAEIGVVSSRPGIRGLGPNRGGWRHF